MGPGAFGVGGWLANLQCFFPSRTTLALSLLFPILYPTPFCQPGARLDPCCRQSARPSAGSVP